MSTPQTFFKTLLNSLPNTPALRKFDPLLENDPIFLWLDVCPRKSICYLFFWSENRLYFNRGLLNSNMHRKTACYRSVRNQLESITVYVYHARNLHSCQHFFTYEYID